MNTLLRKSLIATLVATPMLISQTASGFDSTTDTYRIYGAKPNLYLDNTTVGKTDWSIMNNYPYGPAESFSLLWYWGVPDPIIGIPIIVESKAPTNSLYIDSSGKIGLGVANPLLDLHVGGNGGVYLENGDSDWALATQSNGFFIVNYDLFTVPMFIGAKAPMMSLVVEGTTGNLGVGTGSPVAPLHVLRSNGTAKIRVEEASTTKAKRVLYELVNNGEIRFSMKNTDPANAKKWDFLMATDGFNISLVGTGGAELLVQNDGGVRMGNKNGGASGFNPTFVLNPLGNLTIDGNLTQGSDRNNKQDIVSVNSVSVLETVAKLPISTWEYKGEDGVKHLGPMAQDFHAAFGLGNNETGISSIDTGGVALAAIKGLNQVVQEKDAKIAVQGVKISLLKQEIKSLKEGSHELTERLTMLENLVNTLVAKKVVMDQ